MGRRRIDIAIFGAAVLQASTRHYMGLFRRMTSKEG
jgi:hypothetical protein